MGIRELASRPDHLSCCEQPGLEELQPQIRGNVQ